MSIDLKKFEEVFYEESLEGLETIENILTNNHLEEIRDEQINAIFRAAHSLKGGSATFEYVEIANFTHEIETYLDKIRNNHLTLTRESVDLILVSVDCLRGMLSSYHANQPVDTLQSNEYKEIFKQLIQGQAVSTSVNASLAQTETPQDEAVPIVQEPKNHIKKWGIEFYPKREFFLTGNEPIRFLRELKALGNLEINVDDKDMPDIDALQADMCYLGWNLVLESDCEQNIVVSVFDWVMDDCKLNVSEIVSEQNSTNIVSVQAESPAHIQVQDEEDTQQPVKKPIITSAVLQEQKKEKKPESSTIRVSVEKMDNLLNMVGELVITQSMLNQIGKNYRPEDLEKLQSGLALLEQNTRELQDSVMRIRMVPISFIFNRIQRVAYDLTRRFNKEVNVEIFGEQTELDKTVMEYLGDPILHLVRNSIDHGIEIPEKRIAAGKPANGTLRLEAFQQGGNIVIEVSDDGNGLNKEKIMAKAKSLNIPFDENSEEEINQLIFQPGFSTADTVSDVSGRGVGMDVVMQNMQSIGGSIVVTTEPGKGTKFSLQLPLTLAILDGQLCRVGSQIFIIPLISIKESLQVDIQKYRNLGRDQFVYQLREEFIPTIRLADAFLIEDAGEDIKTELLVILEAGKQKIGVFVDELLEQQQVVIKSLEDNCKKILGISGATILGNGTVSLIIDVTGLMSIYKRSVAVPSGGGTNTMNETHRTLSRHGA